MSETIPVFDIKAVIEETRGRVLAETCLLRIAQRITDEDVDNPYYKEIIRDIEHHFGTRLAIVVKGLY